MTLPSAHSLFLTGNISAKLHIFSFCPWSQSSFSSTGFDCFDYEKDAHGVKGNHVFFTEKYRDIMNMAKFLKSVYFKASSHSKFCSYSTKPNPYVDILKTLRIREQDLRKKHEVLSYNKETPYEETGLPSQSSDANKQQTVNADRKKIYLNESTSVSVPEQRVKWNEQSSKSDASKTDKIEFSKERLDFGSRNKHLQAQKKSTLFQEREQFLNKLHSENKSKKIKVSDACHSQIHAEAVKKSNDSVESSVNKFVASSESQKQKKKKAKVNENSGDSSTKGKFKSLKSKAKAHHLILREDQKEKAKLDSAKQSLKSLVEAHINGNEIKKAHQLFEYFLHDKKKNHFVDVDLFNIMISGWSRQGKLDSVKQLFQLMANRNIPPNLQSYVAYFEAVSRSKYMDVAEIPKVIKEMESHGFSPKDLLQNGIFVGDQREKVIEALGFVERDLRLPLYVPGEAYSYNLLEKLNDKNYEKSKNRFDFCYQAHDIPKLTASQMEIEEAASIKIKSVNAVPELTDKVLKCRAYIKECEVLWKKLLIKAINGLKTPRKPQGLLGLAPNQSVYPYLSLIKTDILVNLLLQEARMLGETAEFYSPNIKVLYKDLGVKVMRHYIMALNKKNNITDKVQFIYQKYLNYLLDPDLYAQYSPREYWELLKSKYCDGPTIDVSNPTWNFNLLVFIGSILYDVLRSNICFDPNRVSKKSEGNFMYPAFHIVYESQDVKLNRQIRAHDVFARLYRDAKLEYLEFDVSIVPMLSPPRPWIKYDSGGMLITEVPFIRFPEQAQSHYSFYSSVPSHQLNPCFDSLNNLSLSPWIINKPILDIVIKIFQEGGSEELDIPLDPAKFTLSPELMEESKEDKKKSYKLRMEYEKKKCEMTSLWFDCLYKLSIANHFRNKVFWFPHNLDFRGRVYPTPPHFNHLGSDMSRSILLFAAGKPLGEKGLDWMKIHLINLTGFKKRAPHAERLEYANEILPEILDSADNPFGGSKWWMKSDKPLQTLACCKELAKAVRHPNPSEYISHFPVHQDGSCNGLQHYAALGRDELGAIEVNLHPSGSPQDVYSGVAALVEKERERDAKSGIEIAEALEGFVTRKVVKQTVMTFVYGVTPYGARLQVLKQLKDMPDFPEKYQHTAATYLMKKIFFSIKEMFTATKKIQDWFTECAEVITRVTEDAVEWVTPLGLPVIQPYFKETVVRSPKFCISKGSKENINNFLSHYEHYQLPNVRKQKNAFAPNFIHSLDSTHMMLTSLFCQRKGVTFVSVHDCYWTHACTVEAMNKICREQFVSMHSEPLLENLSTFFIKRYARNTYKNCDITSKQIKAIDKMQDILKAVPEKGTFNLNLVLESEYFFS